MRGDQVLQLPPEPLFWRVGGNDWARYTGWDLPAKVELLPSPGAPKAWLLRVLEEVPSDLRPDHPLHPVGKVITARSREIRGTWAECAPAYEADRAAWLAAKAAHDQAKADREQLRLALQRLGYPTDGQHTVDLPIATATALVSLAAQVQQLTTGEV
jgi:hypothetical protein